MGESSFFATISWEFTSMNCQNVRKNDLRETNPGIMYNFRAVFFGLFD